MHFFRKTVTFWTDLLVCDLSGTCKVSAFSKSFSGGDCQELPRNFYCSAFSAVIVRIKICAPTRGTRSDLHCEGCVVVVVSRLPPPRFELQIFRLPGKGGYSTRPPGTTESLIIWVEVYVASVTYFPPTERGSAGRGGRGLMKGGKLGSCSCCK
jgi:hypothetical protein